MWLPKFFAKHLAMLALAQFLQLTACRNISLTIPIEELDMIENSNSTAGSNVLNSISLGNVNVFVNLVVNGIPVPPKHTTTPGTPLPPNGTVAPSSPAPVITTEEPNHPTSEDPVVSVSVTTNGPNQTTSEIPVVPPEVTTEGTKHTTSENPVVPPEVTTTQEEPKHTTTLKPVLPPETTTEGPRGPIECGGAIKLRPDERFTFKYPASGNYERFENCMWTLNSGQEEMEIYVTAWDMGYNDGVICYFWNSTTRSMSAFQLYSTFTSSDRIGRQAQIPSPASCSFFSPGGPQRAGFTFNIMGVGRKITNPVSVHHIKGNRTGVELTKDIVGASAYQDNALAYIAFQLPGADNQQISELDIDYDIPDPNDSLSLYELKQSYYGGKAALIETLTGADRKIVRTGLPLLAVFSSDDPGGPRGRGCTFSWYTYADVNSGSPA